MVEIFRGIPQGLIKIEQKSGEAWKKQAECEYTEEQYGFLTDKQINFVDKKVVDCHESIQSSTIIERKIG